MRSVVSRQTVRSFSTSLRYHKDAKTRYILSMFPYPSGRLHMGHMRVYSISDALSQYYRLNGYNVLHPIGWDSFGLPAENAARLMGVQPSEWTTQNIEVMRQQLKRTGVHFDWDREISTCQPDYYKWTQWIFVKLFEHNLVHRRFSSVFWDPVDETVLAAEQIDANGRSWRSEAIAEKRKLKQWAIETPKYAKRLFDGLNEIKDDWQEVAAIQANWIGKCDVFRFILPVVDNGKSTGEVLDLRISDPGELSRAEFIILQSDHPLADQEQNNQYVSTKVVTNFLNGRKLPIVFLAPNEHENQQQEFFMKSRLGFAAKSSFDKLLANSLGISDTASQLQTADQILEAAKQCNVGGYQTSRILQDWVVSRQRAWGTPIPIVIDNENEEICRPVPVSLLPVLSEQRGQIMPNNGRIETDTLDTFFDSSWYYLRFLDPFNQRALADPNKIAEHMPVDVYVGGIEHADVHLFFARFISHFLYDIGVTNVLEPFQRLLPQGFVKGQTFIELGTGRYVPADDVEVVGEHELRSKSSGKSIEMQYEKMSKSKANGVDPIEIIDEIGVDLTRLQLLGVSAPRAHLNWGENDLKGMRKWIERMHWVVETYVAQRQAYPTPSKFELVPSKRESYYKENYNYFVRNISICLEILNLHNTAIARLQGLTNTLRKLDIDEAGLSVELERCVHALVVMLQIFAPNTAQELWELLLTAQPIRTEVRNDAAPLSEQRWPQVDSDAEIDFFVMMMDITCSRVTIPRETIECLDDAKLIEFAKNDSHKAFFKLLTDHSIRVSSIRTKRHSGFDVILDLTSPEITNTEQLKRLLNKLASEKVRSRKEAKKQRRETGQASR